MAVRFLVVMCGFVLCATAAAGQSPGRRSGQPAARRPAQVRPAAPRAASYPADMAIGWALLAQGKAAEATAKAKQVLGYDPRNAAAIQLAVQAETVRGGVDAGLAEYERHLGKGQIEEPALLRQLAHLVLRNAAAEPNESAARTEAIRLLETGGSNPTPRKLDQADISNASPGTLRTLAAQGDPQAVQVLIDRAAKSPEPLGDINALGKSRSPEAASVLIARLNDHRPEIRGAAVDALAAIGATQAMDRFKALLSDPTSYVRTRAAAALYQMGDASGLEILQSLATNESAASRLIAAEAMASHPDGSWLSLVRSLTEAQEPEVRLGAARLLAPHDPERARQVIAELSRDSNLTIREMAAEAAGEIVQLPDDLTGLRGLIKAGNDDLVRVRAAGKILALTA